MKIVMNGKVIDILDSVPIMEVTKEEYDALTEEEKAADILYIVNDPNASAGDGVEAGPASKDLDMNNFRIINLADPVDGTDAVTKKYVDDAVSTGVANASPIHVYSTTEKVVGKWIDGKDVYEKCVTFTTPNDGSQVSMGIRVSSVIDIKFVGLTSGNYVVDYNYNDQYTLSVYVGPSDPILVVRALNSEYMNRQFIAIIQYTKP